jgi:hypothetical protein
VFEAKALVESNRAGNNNSCSGNGALPIPQSHESCSQGGDDDVQIRLDVPRDGYPLCGGRSLGRGLGEKSGDSEFRHQNTMAMDAQPDATFTLYPQLTPVQARAFQLLGVAVNL